MKKIFSNWKNYIKESKYQDEYSSVFHLRFSETTGGSISETIRFIRAILYVTQVRVETQFFETESAEIGSYIIKFVLRKGSDPSTYVATTLKPGLRKIPGLSIIKYLGTRAVEAS